MHTETRFQCRHIHANGRRCGSPSLRQEPFCYYHHTTRRPVHNLAHRRAAQAHFDLPLPEDRAAIQIAIGQVLQRIAANDLDPRRAGLLLYGLQIASSNLPREAAPAKSSQPQDAGFIEQIVEDPTYGPLAPEAELTEYKNPIHEMVERLLKQNQDRQNAPEPEPTQPATEETENPPTTEETEPQPAAENEATTQPAAEAPPQPAATQPPEFPTILPQIQACRATKSARQRTSHLHQKVEVQSRLLALSLRGPLKRKAVDDPAVANPLSTRGPNPVSIQIQVADSTS